MSKDKISSQEMTDQVAASLSVSKRVAEEFLKSLFAEIEETLLNGEPVKIKNLGTFKMQWNEPRKSVNVQTGEVIILDGYNKVTFTPEIELKDAINEPYSHLDAVELDESSGQSESSQPEASQVIPEVTEGLRNLSEQAFEIKGLLSEINALSIKEKAPQPKVRDYEIPDYELILIDEEPETVPNIEETEDTEETEETDKEEAIEEINLTAELIEIQASFVEETATAPTLVEDANLVEEAQIELTEVVKVEEQIIDREEKNEVVETIEVVEETEVFENNENIEDTQKLEQHTQEEEIAYKKESKSEEPAYSPLYEQIPQLSYQPSNTELKEAVSSPFILGKTKKKRKGLKFLLVLILLLGLITGGIYIAYAGSSCFSCWFKYTLLSEENRDTADKYWSNVKGWFDFSDKKEASTPQKTNTTPKAVANDSVHTDTILETEDSTSQEVTEQKVVEAPDSFDIAFKNRRNYTVFIGEETISEGTRLTTVSQQYYGKREFWVYIYEANRDNIVHPDRITPGTVVKVPKVDPRIIDKKNPKCLQKVRELHDLYVGKK